MTLLSQDRRLLMAFRAGEDAALRDVFRHYAPRVAKSIRRGVKVLKGRELFRFRGPSEEMEVERLVQETFSRAFSANARQSYDGITPFEAYVCRIARNVMITEAQQARRTPQPTEDGEVPDLAALTPTPEELVSREELRRLVAEFLEGRPDDEKQVFDARFRHGDSQEAAASRLQVNRITVRRTEARLKAAFVRFMLRRRAVGRSELEPPEGKRP